METLINPCCDILFPLYLVSVEYPGDPALVTEACYALKKSNPNGVLKSNQGGWQSDIQTLTEGPKVIKNLAEYVLKISNTEILKLYKEQRNKLSVCDWWVNINKGTDYNEAHTHGDIQFIAIYYPQLCLNPGELCLYSPYNCSTKYGTTTKITPVENRIFFLPGPIVHSVSPSTSTEKDRVSIAFNID
jgi:hypothetical protein